MTGEAVVLWPEGLSRFEELSGREAARTAVLYAFDLIEHDGEDLRILPFLERKAALARLMRDTEAGILLNEHIAEDGATVFPPCVINRGASTGWPPYPVGHYERPFSLGPVDTCGLRTFAWTGDFKSSDYPAVICFIAEPIEAQDR